MNRNLIFLPFFALALPSASAQALLHPIDNAAQLALGGASVAFPQTEGGISNPAQLGLLRSTQLFAWSALPYGLVPIRSQGVQVLHSFQESSGWALGILHSGIEGYTEQRFQASYGRKLGEHWSIGGSIYAPRVSAADYGARTALRMGLGMLMQPIPGLRVGAVLEDPFPSPSPDALALTTMRMGAHWTMSSLLEWAIEASRALRNPTQVRLGLVYRAHPKVQLRFGTRTRPLRIAFGAGLELFQGFHCDIASEWHTVLGWTPALMVVWSRPKRV
jgi:hypothetical protein